MKTLGKQITSGAEILAEVIEIEKHLHNHEKWFGDAASSSAETHHADRMNGTIASFDLTSGTSAFNSTWTQVLGSTDTPVEAGKTKFDLHRIIVIDTDSTLPFIVQIVTGESGDIAAKISSEDFTEFPYVAASNNIDSGISDVIDVKSDAGTKVWMRCACVGATGKIIKLYFGLHEYDE